MVDSGRPSVSDDIHEWNFICQVLSVLTCKLEALETDFQQFAVEVRREV